MVKLSDYVSQFIARLGARPVFLLPGGGSMHLVDSVGKQPELDVVGMLHEQSCAFAAEAAAQYTGDIGVALVTTGPGGTNAITGVAAAWIDSTPLLVISGQAKVADLIGDSGLRQRGVQEVDIVPIVGSITKYAVTVTDPARIRAVLEEAVHHATSGRPGPVWVDVPLDVQGAQIDETKLDRFQPAPVQTPDLGDVAARMASLLSASRRPVILAGNGIRLAGALDDFRGLIDQLGVPVLTTWKAVDFIPDDHPLFFGRPGSIASRAANFIQQNADLILVLGARLDLPQVGFSYTNFARGATKVVVDIDQAEIDKLTFGDGTIGLRMGAGQFIEALGSGEAEACRRPDWLARCAQWSQRYPLSRPEPGQPARYVNPYALVDRLSEALGSDDLLVPGSSGACSEVTLQAFRVKSGQRVFNTPGLGAMGSGLPAAIGACIASGRRTITIIGDGGLQHNIQELATVAHRDLPLKIFILDNGGYGSIRATQTRYFDGRFVCCDTASGLPVPDLVRIAEAYGLRTTSVNGQDDLDSKIADVLDRGGPVLCTVLVDPDQPTAPKLASTVRSDGTIVSRPLEDLWPFLSREELAANMIIDPLPED